MKAGFISSLALTLALLTLISSAAAQELPDPGITPDSWMYGIKRAFESITLILTFDEVAKVEKRLQYAELRLIEAKVMAEKGKPEYVEKLLEDYQKELEEVSKVIPSAKDKEKLSELVALATSRHLEVLDKVTEVVPEEAKEKVSLAKEMSIRGNQEALRALASLNPEKAAEIAMKVAEKRLNRVMHSAEKGDVEGVNRAVDEYKRYASFGEEIASIAQQAGKDPAKVHEIVVNATSIHLSVLRDTLQEVPDEAKDQI
ncbi:hypothetical protein DRP07_04430, partial [Archaeoglobales archaeon]